MILLNCHIENFGKLHDLSIDFTEKENIICQDNGWGKSTLSAFIRAMFYGLEGESKRTYEGNEKKKYAPWQGGAFGGSITFEANGKTYTVTRMFHEQNNFELRETKTNKISQDFSENLGEELFKINRESFMRTVFIGQNDCTTNATGDINAKIGNITENSNDMNSFEAATERLTKVMNSMTPKRITGSIARRANEITELERKVLEGSTLSDSMEQYQVRLNEERKAYEALKAQVQEVGKEQEIVTKWQAIQTKLETCEDKANAFALSDVQQAEFYQLEEMFRDELPQDDKLTAMRQKAERLRQLREQQMKEQLTQEEERQLSTLSERFSDESVSITGVVEKWNVRNAKKTALPSNQAALNALKASMEMTSQKGNKSIGIFGIGIVLAVIGCILLAIQMYVPGLALAAVGVVAVAFGIIVRKKETAPKYNPQDLSVLEMQKQLDEDTNLIRQIDNEVIGYLAKHGKAYEEFMVGAMLQEIMKDYISYTNLIKKREKVTENNCNAEAEEISRVIYEFLKRFLAETAEERYVDDLYQVKHKRDTYVLLKQKKEQHQKAKLAITDARKELLQFEEMHHITDEHRQVSIAAFNEKVMKLTDDLDNSRKAIDGYNRNLEELQGKVDEWEEHKIRLAELKELQDAELKKYQCITKAKAYLALAKEAITQKYAGPILESFMKYYDMITEQEGRRFYIDANTNITIEEHGKQRESITQSLGYKDLIGICLRIAFVDAMYQEEKPVLIMDDPFVNLDDKKQEKAMEFLKMVAEKYQIIYFTCSSSRSV